MKKTTFLVIFIILLKPQFNLKAQTIVEQKNSTLFHLSKNGKLVYSKDSLGNRLPDFSYVGYHSGEKPIPKVPVKMTLKPIDGDNTEHIQNALNKLGKMTPNKNGFRGALLLKKGHYPVNGLLNIANSGIVLRGEGNGIDGTVIIATGFGNAKHKRTFITVGKNSKTIGTVLKNLKTKNLGLNKIELIKNSKQQITDTLVPIGSNAFCIKSVKNYKVGNKIIVARPSTKDWINSIGCDKLAAKWTTLKTSKWVKDGDAPGFYYNFADSHERSILKKDKENWETFVKRIPLNEDGKKINITKQWTPGTYDLWFERSITKIEGNCIYIDIPLVHTMKAKFGGGAIYKYNTPGRITEVGIENLRLISEFSEPLPGQPYGSRLKARTSELHAWNAIHLTKNTENTWVRNITGKYFGWSLISASGIRATIQDCANLAHASKILGGRRYPFMIDGQLNLMQRCIAVEGRHEFVTQSKTSGPNVFVDCIGYYSKSPAGPHHRYSVGTLFDNVKSEKPMESRFRGNSGTGHGWAGTQTCFYNCVAPEFMVEAPKGGVSWILGSGIETEKDIKMKPASLYYQQVQDRLGKNALMQLTSQEYLETLGEFIWVKKLLKNER